MGKLTSDLENFLFNFTDPFKIDLEHFMNGHYLNNKSLSQFEKLSGRCLSTFKRDFQKIYDTPPERWLREKRLVKAHFLIKEDHQKPSEVYLKVGFENFSHFSISFKEHFGYNASTL